MAAPKHIVVFEHQKLLFNINDKDDMLLYQTLTLYHGDYCPYFKLINKGVQFCEFVGVLQVGSTLIEVLPKADAQGEGVWRSFLIQMIQQVYKFNVNHTSEAQLQLRKDSLLDVYFQLFVHEVEYLMHMGLIKRYKKVENNQNVLKGRLVFSKHLNYNLVHKERFFVNHTQYAVNHTVHQILYKTLCLLQQLNQSQSLKSRISALLLYFPEVDGITVTEATFVRLVFDRKNAHYKKVLQIAEMILLNYHPDVTKGKRNVLALMFNMNRLWEQFIYTLLKKQLPHFHVKSQLSKKFWQPSQGSIAIIKPDIVLTNQTTNETFVLDTKWKNLNGKNPSLEDLRQMYVYHNYYQAVKTALVYPGLSSNRLGGTYVNTVNNNLSDYECSVIQIGTTDTFKQWKEKIVDEVVDFINFI